jgi:hypothetical protein
MAENKRKGSGKEPVFIVKPALKNFGLDYLHITLIALVIILVVLALALSTFKPGTIVKTCSNGSACNSTNNSTSGTIHTSAQALIAAKNALASYSNLNTSLSLIPYYSLVNQSKVDYLNNSKEWLVIVPYIDPLANGTVFNISLLFYDSNLTLASAYIQTLKPAVTTNNSVVGLGTVQLSGQIACKTSKPVPLYIITDPYSPGMLKTLDAAVNASEKYKGSINASYYFIFSGYSQSFYNGYGELDTQQMGRYLYCASNQRNFPQFVSNLSIAYTGRPLSNLTLYQVSLGSNLNTTMLNVCMQNVTTSLNYQSEFANLYHIVSTPTIIVNCQYTTLPQTLDYAINYSLAHQN